MYESHFGFTGSPFQLNPDPAFYFESRGHSNALAYLKFGAHQGEGFIVVTGEIGAGKTTLVRTLLEGLDPEQVVAAQVVSTQLESNELLQAILMAFGIPSGNASKAHLIANLEGYFTALAAKGKRALLIIDEAQNLKHEAVEELRMLSNFQLGKYGLLQSFLVGQPELRTLLQSKSMEQLRQRVIASCHLGPLTQAETCAYVQHRLRRVGWNNDSPSFTGTVFDRIHEWTGGVPRRINRLCNRLLLGAFLANASTITEAMVDETALELKNEIGEAGAAPVGPIPEAAPIVSDTQAAQITRPQARTTQPRHEPPAPNGMSANPSNGRPDAPPRQLQGQAELVLPGKPVGASVISATPPAAPAPLIALPGDPASPTDATPVRRIHRATASLHEPLLCAVGSAADYLKAGVLERVFQSFPSLPRVIAVHSGTTGQLGIDDLDGLQMPLPAAGLHLGVPNDSFAPHAAKLIHAFDAVLTEFRPRAILTMGNSDAELAISLVARKAGIPLLRLGAGRRIDSRGANGESNAALIEKISNILYTDSSEAFYALYREGIRLDHVHSVGSLTREMLDLALATLQPGAARPGHSASEYGLIGVDPNAGFMRGGQLLKAIDLFCEWGSELPMTWLLNPGGFQLVQSLHADRLRASRILLQEHTTIRAAFDLVRGSKCLISHDQGPWLEEARLLGVCALTLNPDFSLDPCDARRDPVPDTKQVDSNQARLHRLLSTSAPLAQAPEYWDSGTATRIAGQLVAWFAKAETQAHALAKTTPELIK